MPRLGFTVIHTLSRVTSSFPQVQQQSSTRWGFSMVPVVIYSRMRRLSARHVSRTSVFELAIVPFCKRVFLAGLSSRYWFNICSSGNEYYLRISISHDSSQLFCVSKSFYDRATSSSLVVV